MNENVSKKIEELKKLKSQEDNLETLIKNEDYKTIEDRIYDFYSIGDHVKKNKYLEVIFDKRKNEGYKLSASTYYVLAENLQTFHDFKKANNLYYAAAFSTSTTSDIKYMAMKKLEENLKKYSKAEIIRCQYKKNVNEKYEFIDLNTSQTLKLTYISNLSDYMSLSFSELDILDVHVYEISEGVKVFIDAERVSLSQKERMEFTSSMNKSANKTQEENVKVENNSAKSTSVKKLYAYEGDLPYAFVSYSHKDSDMILPIIEGLQTKGFRVWFDQGIEAGTEWPQYIAEHLNGSECVLICVSKNAEESINCRNEINLSCSLNKNILVLRLEDDFYNLGVRLQLESKQAIYKSRHANVDTLVDELGVAKLLQKCK